MAVRILKYCGKERLPGGERRWRKLAETASFDGSISVFGYGTGGLPGQQQCRAYITQGSAFGATLGDWQPGKIRVWLPCSGCAAVEFDPDLELAEGHDEPLTVFAHELGHERQWQLDRGYETVGIDEAVASRYGRWLLRKVP